MTKVGNKEQAHQLSVVCKKKKIVTSTTKGQLMNFFICFRVYYQIRLLV